MIGEGSRLLRAAAGLAADLLWPRTCAACGAADRMGPGGVCDRCWGLLQPAPAVESPRALDRLAVAFAYDDTLQPIIHRFKFAQTPTLARPLAERFEARLAQMGFVFYDSILMPVPTHRARRRERGYNPAELLANELATRLGLPCRPELGRRTVHGPHQSTLPDAQRKRGLAGAFELAPPPPGSTELLRLVLVDDVVHTGRTLGQLARAARKAGWQKVDGVVLSA